MSLSHVPALVLTAGFGTRLRPLSAVRAKPAMPVAGDPLVRRILGWLRASGVARAVLNLHHLPETVTAAVGDGADLGLSVRYSWEQAILGSAGGPRRALPLLDADGFLIVNGDTLTDLDVDGLVAEHERSGALVTLALIPNPDPEHYGGVLVDDSGAVTRFVPRGTPGPSWHFVGVQVARARTFERVPADTPWESVGGLYPALMKERPGSVRAYRTDGVFRDIGTPADYLDTSLALAEAEGRAARLVGAGCHVAPTARLERSVLWDRVRVGDHAALTDCVVADDVEIPSGAWFSRRAIVRADRAPGQPGERYGDLLLSPMIPVVPAEHRPAEKGPAGTRED
jgi:mannose-1-phosphate guanylyltransferase